MCASQHTIRAAHSWRYASPVVAPIPLDGTEGDPFQVVRLYEVIRPGVVRRVGERLVWRT